jgi:heme/copper-type cytochrome/quinol oxidase subunit 2
LVVAGIIDGSITFKLVVDGVVLLVMAGVLIGVVTLTFATGCVTALVTDDDTVDGNVVLELVTTGVTVLVVAGVVLLDATGALVGDVAPTLATGCVTALVTDDDTVDGSVVLELVTTGVVEDELVVLAIFAIEAVVLVTGVKSTFTVLAPNFSLAISTPFNIS